MKDLYQKAKDSGTGVHKLVARNLMYNATKQCVGHLLSVANSNDGGHLESNEEALAYAEAARVSDEFYGSEGLIERTGEPEESEKVNHLESAHQCMETIKEMMSEGIKLYPAVVICNRKMKIHEPRAEEVAEIQKGFRDVEIVLSDEEVVQSIKENRKGYVNFVSRNKDKACALFLSMAEDHEFKQNYSQHEDYPDWVKMSFDSAMTYAYKGCLNPFKPLRQKEALSERKQLQAGLDTH